MNILLTGGTGYIGSHTAVDLLSKGYEVTILDNLSNSKKDILKQITNISGSNKLKFYRGDLRFKNTIDNAFKENDIESVIHFASLKSLPESVSNPFEYYENNLIGFLNLLDKMKENSIKNIIFSSSASVYSQDSTSPISEDSPIHPHNPYANTKIIIEQIIYDAWKGGIIEKGINLRYFNPVGAHESSLIGENPLNIPTNIMPVICRVANRLQPNLEIFGDNYATKDGTGIRDFIHIQDLSHGHFLALNKILSKEDSFNGIESVNLGTGKGYSVLELVKTFEEVNNVDIPIVIKDRRPGDLPIVYADPSFAYSFLSWKSERDLKKMCFDSWNWMKNKK